MATPTFNSILGFLKDSGEFTAVITNRLEDLFRASRLDVGEFVKLTDGRLAELYNRDHPGSKGLGKGTYAAMDRFRGRYNYELHRDMKAAETAAAVDEAVKETACERLESEFLARELDITVLKDTVAWIEVGMPQGKVTLKTLLEFYKMKGGSR